MRESRFINVFAGFCGFYMILYACTVIRIRTTSQEARHERTRALCTFGAAREKVRTARALGNLPLIDAAFRDAQLSYSKVRALTRAATPDSEAELLARARTISADGVEQLVRRVKYNECLETDPSHGGQPERQNNTSAR